MTLSLFLFQYSNKVSSPSSAAGVLPVVAKPRETAPLKNEISIIKTNFEPSVSSESQSTVRHKVVTEDKEWQKIEVDSSKLGKHYLMLSKIRLTCKYDLTSSIQTSYYNFGIFTMFSIDSPPTTHNLVHFYMIIQDNGSFVVKIKY